MEGHDGFARDLPNDPLARWVTRNRTVLKPHGVWAVIAPFNFPYALAGGPVAAALATGNTVVFKTASDTAWSGWLLLEVLRDAGLPAGVVNYVSGSGGATLAQRGRLVPQGPAMYVARLPPIQKTKLAVSFRPVARLLNLPALLRHLRAHRADRCVHDPAEDLELALYGAIFGNDFLHYGYFAQPPADAESISFAQLKRAMDDYASLLAERVRAGERVLDVGCGMGGLLARLDAAGAQVVGVTPNAAHAAHIRARWPQIPLIESVFERIDATTIEPRFDAIVNAESFQYIDLDAGMRNVRALLAPGGRWIVSDYFRLRADARNRSGHLLADFEAALARHGLAVAERVDITDNVLPTLAYGRLLATRFALPLARFASEKFFLRRPLVAYLLRPTVRAKLDAVRLDTLDPDVFRRDKRYLLFTLRPD